MLLGICKKYESYPADLLLVHPYSWCQLSVAAFGDESNMNLRGMYVYLRWPDRRLLTKEDRFLLVGSLGSPSYLPNSEGIPSR